MAKSNSQKSLVIVESPAKAKTINRYLGPDYEVKASMGHVRDLPSKGLNVDIENNFEPTYDIMPGKKRVVAQLKAAAKKCDKLYLATDLDREGEAIAWHLAEILGVPEDRTYRVIFNAITKTAIKEAFAEPGRINMDKVMAQQARRVLDRIVGYEISPLLWKKVTRGLSAGRVQSVAVKIIVEREREIRAFKPEEYWLIPAVFTTDLNSNYQQQWLDFITPKTADGKGPTVEQQSEWLAEHNAFKAELFKIGDAKFNASNEQEAQKIFQELEHAQFKIADIETKESVVEGFAAVHHLDAAAGGRQPPGLHRQADDGGRPAALRRHRPGLDGLAGPDHVHANRQHVHLRRGAQRGPRATSRTSSGPSTCPRSRTSTRTRNRPRQAHEAIRPTDVDLTPQEIRQHLNDEQFKLYDLIWRRFVACQMEPARWNVTTLSITAQTSAGVATYKAGGRSLVFDGYSRVWQTSSSEQQLPPTQVGQSLATVDIRPEQHFTKPPARYTEASLVKALEKEGIGRPSTYAPIISTIQDRGYVEQKDRKFFATDLGEVVTDKLNEYFPQIMDIAFTRQMEEQLDQIEEQHLDWVRVLKEFYGPFKANLDTATAEMKHAKAEATPSEYTCPDCSRQLFYKFGKNGRFLSCSGYPECKFASPLRQRGQDDAGRDQRAQVPQVRQADGPQERAVRDVPRVQRLSRLQDDPAPGQGGQPLPPKPPAESTGIKCHKCKTGELVIRQSKRGPFLGCNKFPRCRTIVSAKGIDRLKELQAAGEWPPKDPQRAQEILNEIKGEKAGKGEKAAAAKE